MRWPVNATWMRITSLRASRNSGRRQPVVSELRHELMSYPLTTRLERLDCAVELCLTETEPLLEVARRSLADQRFDLRPIPFP